MVSVTILIIEVSCSNIQLIEYGRREDELRHEWDEEDQI